VKLSAETRLLLAENSQGEALIHLNRLLLDDAYPRELFSSGASTAGGEDDVGAGVRAGLGFVRPAGTDYWREDPSLGGHSTGGAHPGVMMLRGLFSYLNIYLPAMGVHSRYHRSAQPFVRAYYELAGGVLQPHQHGRV